MPTTRPPTPAMTELLNKLRTGNAYVYLDTTHGPVAYLRERREATAPWEPSGAVTRTVLGLENRGLLRRVKRPANGTGETVYDMELVEQEATAPAEPEQPAEPQQTGIIGCPEYDVLYVQATTGWASATLYCQGDPARAEALAAQFPARTGVRSGTLMRHDGRANDGHIGWSARIGADGVNGGKNETGMKRYRALRRRAEELRLRVEWTMPYGNSLTYTEFCDEADAAAPEPIPAPEAQGAATSTGERSEIREEGPSRPGNGTSRTWSRTIAGVPYRFTAVTMPDGERRYTVDRYNGYLDDGTEEGRARGMRWGCAWSPAHWITVPAANDEPAGHPVVSTEEPAVAAVPVTIMGTRRWTPVGTCTGSPGTAPRSAASASPVWPRGAPAARRPGPAARRPAAGGSPPILRPRTPARWSWRPRGQLTSGAKSMRRARSWWVVAPRATGAESSLACRTGSAR